jgi:hypothetical protein
VGHELVEGAEQPPLPKQDQTIETLLSDRPHEPFGVIAKDPGMDGRGPG